ncbi:polysaccharide deacetylase family protein [Thermopolyspora sp. NPDC052614]|uniref:polysaccharide deacetylase family protein n=1 Tax=Thermopolyspora sp. NPDC052614 TaxID=3155682 RepID=UPI003435C3B6
MSKRSLAARVLAALAVLAPAALVPAVLAPAALVPAVLAPASAAASADTARVNCAKVKCIALTFDDGPAPVTTARLLDTLREHRVKATFFLVGERVAEHPAIVRRMAREGHEIGNHTYRHQSLPALPDFDVVEELSRTQEAIRGVTGRRPTLMRPPYGHTDARVSAVNAELGLAQILWTGTTLDWSLRDVDAIGDKVLALAKPNGVILMHDVVPHTVKAMPRILRELRKRGYHLVTVSTLAGTGRLTPGSTFPPR